MRPFPSARAAASAASAAALAALGFTAVLSGLTLAQAHAQASAPAAAPAPVAPVSAAERKAVVEQMAKALEDNFAIPEVGVKYAAVLRANLAAGVYDGLTDPAELGKRVTADLQAVFKDTHLRLAPASAFGPIRATLPAAAPASTAPAAPVGIEEAKMIGDVAYIRFNMFPEDPAVAQQAGDFLRAHADAKGVIIDARPHRGGGMMVMDAMLPLLYPQRTLLVRMDARTSSGDRLETASVVHMPAPATVMRDDHYATPDTKETRLQRVPVYYLTSHRTASAGEHLALALKRTHRATLIGETTRGAGRFGAGLTKIDERFAAFIPVGRTYDPDTGLDWEGVGVEPDVAVPADQALDEALKRLKAAGVRVESGDGVRQARAE
jgi:hypothetical protein